VDVAGRDATARRADVLADGEVGIMIHELFLRDTLRMPELRVSGIQIDERTFAKTRFERPEGEMPADVHQ
jgi:hypothetical protein